MFILVFRGLFLGYILIVETMTAKEEALNTLDSFSDSFFASLPNYADRAEVTNEKHYPWVARVIHSRTRDIPFMCTAVCIEPAIFITAARCIYTLKSSYTTIIYKSLRLRALAFVLPSERSKQAFDDIGFIVVENSNITGTWSAVKLFDKTNRTDTTFTWFAKYRFPKVIAVGYADPKADHLKPYDERYTQLYHQEVVIEFTGCPKTLSSGCNSIEVFVPCYYPCHVTDLDYEDYDVCLRAYLGTEGGAVYDASEGKLIGIATWGSQQDYDKAFSPVGFSVPNSENFFKDFTCAKRIRDDVEADTILGYYQSLCNL